MHAQVVAAIAAFEPVTLVADPAHADDARRRVTAENVELVALPIDDSWLRDSGPIVVAGPDGRRAGIDFRFNAWGEAFAPYDKDASIALRLLEQLGIEHYASPMVLEGGAIAVDGTGRLVTTEQCLLNPNRNALLERDEIERELSVHLGAEQVVWLGHGLVEDADTDGHVDNICAFLASRHVLLAGRPRRGRSRTTRTRRRTRIACATPASRSSAGSCCRARRAPTAASSRSPM